MLKQRTLGRDILLSEHSHSYVTVIFPELPFSWSTSAFQVNHVAIKKVQTFTLKLLKASLRKWTLVFFPFCQQSGSLRCFLNNTLKYSRDMKSSWGGWGYSELYDTVSSDKSSRKICSWSLAKKLMAWKMDFKVQGES